MSHARALALLLLTACAGGAASSGVGGVPLPSTALRPEDRVLLGDFSRVTALASSFDRVYVAYPGAVAIWRPALQRWEVPRSPRDPRILQDVFAGVIDPTDQSLWLATSTGYVHYQPDIDRWDSGIIAGRITGIADDPENGGAGIWFRTTTGWMLQPRFGPAAPGRPRVSLRQPPGINDAYADIPQLRSLAPRLLTGAKMVQGNFTAAAPSTNGNGWYLGTSNRGLLFLDRTRVEPELLTVGLPGETVGAVATTPDGIWVINDIGLRTPAAITFLEKELTRADPLPGSAVFGLPFDAARAIMPGDRALWLATDKGLVRASLDDGKTRRWDIADGLPDSRVTSLAQSKGELVAGTMRGLVQVDAEGRLTRRGKSFDGPVYALKANGDTLWVGTSFGLYASLTGDDSLRMPEGFRQLGAIPAVLGIGYVADTLMVMTPDHVVWRDPVTGAWTRGPDLGSPLGQLHTMVTTPDGAWIAGVQGVGFVRPTTTLLRTLMIGNDLPAQVTSIATSGEYLWVGTVVGLVRFRLLGR